MDAYAIWLSVFVADAMLCNFGQMPTEGLALLRHVKLFAHEKHEQIACATTQDEYNALQLASRVRDWTPTGVLLSAMRMPGMWVERRLARGIPSTRAAAATAFRYVGYCAQ
jgi:hypothetical protein